jgi:replicative DNA helicase
MTHDYSNDEMGLPASVSVERMVLGAALLEPDRLAEAQEKLRIEDFVTDSHQRIYRRLTDLAAAGRKIELTTLAEELAKHKEIDSVGGVAYILRLTEGLPRRPAIDEYVRILVDKSRLRQLILTCQATIARAADQSEPALDVMSYLEGRLEMMANSSEDSSDLESVGQWLNQNDVFAERAPGIMSGLDEYDELTGGYQPGELTVIAGRPGSGKTSMACTLTWQIARQGKSVGAFINEQRKQSFAGRMMCGRSGVSFKSYKHGTLDWVEKQYIEDAMRDMKTWPIYWESRTPMTIASVRAKSRRLHRAGDLDILEVDQLSGLSNDGFAEKGRRSDEIIGAKVKALKNIAVELGIPVVVFVQLTRSSTKNAESRPTLADLKGSGEIEDHADNVDLIHRPRYYDRDSKEDDLIIRAKSRDGETGDVRCEFVPGLCLWRNRKK